MKRKLFAACAGIAALVSVMLLCGYSPGGDRLAGNYLEDGEQVCISAVVTRRDGGKIYLTSVVINECAAASQQNIPIKDRLIIEYDDLQDTGTLRVGSYVILSGIFSEFSHATNPGEFDAAKYYRLLKIGGRLKGVEIIGMSEQYSIVGEALCRLREAFAGRLYSVFPDREAGIMCTILLADREGLDSEVKNMYMRNGIIHILSISGLHITIIGMGLYRALRKAGMPGGAAAVIGGTVLILYGIMTGMGISVCRAIGMYLIKMFSLLTKRTYDMMTALGVMAVVMLISNPLCIGQAGFLLSFASIIGIGVIYPLFVSKRSGEASGMRYERSGLLKGIKDGLKNIIGGIYSSAAAGVSITLMTLPIQLWFYYEVPVYSVILNLFVLPMMGVLLMTGLIAMLVPHMGIVGSVSCLILRVYEELCGIFDRLPVNTWNPGRPSVWEIVVYYALLSAGVWYAYHAGEAKKLLPSAIAVAAAAAVIGINITVENSVTFLDVGQGDSIVVRTKAGGVYLFDCGSTGRGSVGEYVLKPYLKYYGISHIDGIIVSHEDADHCNGIVELLDHRGEWGIEIENILLPYVEGEEFEDILSVCAQEKAGTPGIIYINTGACWQDGTVKFTCMHPPEAWSCENINAASACFLVESGDYSLLLTGDVEAEGEELLLEELKNADISEITMLKVAHHGSRNSTSAELLNTVKPLISVISCGKSNTYGHPHDELIDRLEKSLTKIYSTMESGAVTVRCSKDNIMIEEWCGSRSCIQN